MPSVALLIPVYQDQEGLEYSLQRLPIDFPLDVIVVDDGSEPPIRAPRVCEPHRVFVIRLGENRGIEYALNAGLKWILEHGYEYVARLDAGDVALPGRFSRQVEFLEANPDYALVGCQVRFVDKDGREVFQEQFPTEYEKIRRIMHARNCFIHPAVMFRTRVLRGVGLYSTQYKAAEDYELFFRITSRHKVANLDDAAVICCVDSSGISRSKRRRQLLSRLKTMWRYFDPLVPESYLGILKTLALLFTPVQLVVAVKRLLPRRSGWL